MRKRMSLNELFTAASQIYDLGIAKGKSSYPKQYPPGLCWRCDTELNFMYMESAIYMVVCPTCETVHLTKAECATEALLKVGHLGGKTNGKV